MEPQYRGSSLLRHQTIWKQIKRTITYEVIVASCIIILFCCFSGVVNAQWVRSTQAIITGTVMMSLAKQLSVLPFRWNESTGFSPVHDKWERRIYHQAVAARSPYTVTALYRLWRTEENRLFAEPGAYASCDLRWWWWRHRSRRSGRSGIQLIKRIRYRRSVQRFRYGKDIAVAGWTGVTLPHW